MQKIFFYYWKNKKIPKVTSPVKTNVRSGVSFEEQAEENGIFHIFSRM